MCWSIALCLFKRVRHLYCRWRQCFHRLSLMSWYTERKDDISIILTKDTSTDTVQVFSSENLITFLGVRYHFLMILQSKNNQIELRYLKNDFTFRLKHVYILNSQEPYWCYPQYLRLVWKQRRALTLSKLCVIVLDHDPWAYCGGNICQKLYVAIRNLSRGQYWPR